MVAKKRAMNVICSEMQMRFSAVQEFACSLFFPDSYRQRLNMPKNAQNALQSSRLPVTFCMIHPRHSWRVRIGGTPERTADASCTSITFLISYNDLIVSDITVSSFGLSAVHRKVQCSYVGHKGVIPFQRGSRNARNLLPVDLVSFYKQVVLSHQGCFSTHGLLRNHIKLQTNFFCL